MRRNILGITLLLCAGCSQLPQWDSPARQASKAEFENAQTQLELTGAAGELTTLAEGRMIAALEYKLSTLPKTKRLALLRDQSEWQRLMDRRNAETMGDGSIAPMMQHGREESRLKNRFLELTVPEEVCQAFLVMKNAPVCFNGKMVRLAHGELDIDIPTKKREGNIPTFETVGQLQIPFCRKIIIGNGTFWIGIITPTNYGVMSSFGEGTESNLCIWKNGGNTANFLIGKRITIQGLSINGETVKVSFLDKDGKLQQKKFNCQTTNDNPVLINHWTTERIN